MLTFYSQSRKLCPTLLPLSVPHAADFNISDLRRFPGLFVDDHVVEFGTCSGYVFVGVSDLSFQRVLPHLRCPRDFLDQRILVPLLCKSFLCIRCYVLSPEWTLYQADWCFAVSYSPSLCCLASVKRRRKLAPQRCRPTGTRMVRLYQTWSMLIQSILLSGTLIALHVFPFLSSLPALVIVDLVVCRVHKVGACETRQVSAWVNLFSQFADLVVVGVVSCCKVSVRSLHGWMSLVSRYYGAFLQSVPKGPFVRPVYFGNFSEDAFHGLVSKGCEGNTLPQKSHLAPATKLCQQCFVTMII